uniref:Neurotrophin-3 n=1 Tax=Panagrolaimus sp. ES5 TaxID=591445 RepID=A0AC34FDJ0_9BILA
MLAASTIENNGITIQDLDDLTASRIRPETVQAGSLKEKVHEVEMEKEKINIQASNTPVIFKERPLTKDNRPPAPFKSRVRREHDDELNPFEDIATRAPVTNAPPLQRLLNREMILGVSGSRPRHRIGVPHEGEMSEKGWMHPRRRRPYIDINLEKSQVVELPLPPEI